MQMDFISIVYMYAGTGLYSPKLYARVMLLSNTTRHQSSPKS